MVGLLLPLAPRAQADTEVSLDFFYNNLSEQGNWIEVGDYGYCFQPNVAVSSSDWRPYADGYWAYTDSGWTWVSYEDFGWATYHYGRWANLDSYGWVWVPGYEWGPAWVSWRTGGDYVGWAPLPPEPVGVVYEGQAITGSVDFTFGIGPLYYNFVDIRYIGEPVLRHRILAPSRNVTIINQTVNVTNITYNNSTVYNHGPDYNRLNQYSTRPIQRLNLQRETTFPAEGGRRANLNRVSGNQLMVTAPAIQKSRQPIAPKQVKTRVDKPKVEHGWQGIADRQQVEARMKKEDPKNVPPPNFQPQKGRERETVAAGEPNAGNVRDVGNAGSAGNAGNAQRQKQAQQRNEQNAQPAGQQSGRLGQKQKADSVASGQQNVPASSPKPQKNDGLGHFGIQDLKSESNAAQQAQEQKIRQDKQRQQQEAEKAQQAQQAQQAKQAQQAQLAGQANRAEQAQQAQRAKRAEQAPRVQEAQQVQQALQPAPAQRSQQVHQPKPQQVRPPQPPQNQNPYATPKGKKKKPADEPPPQA
jgi:hypothetical protein